MWLANGYEAIILGKQWQLATEETKAHFKNAADILKKKHLEAYPNYQYQPRKSSEKKRRVTRRREESTTAAGTATTSAGIADNVNSGEVAIDATDVDEVVPQFETTSGGFPTFNLGDPDYDEETFAAMLEEFNASLGHDAGILPGPVLYSEPTEEAHEDNGLFHTFLHFDKLLQDA